LIWWHLSCSQAYVYRTVSRLNLFWIKKALEKQTNPLTALLKLSKRQWTWLRWHFVSKKWSQARTIKNRRRLISDRDYRRVEDNFNRLQRHLRQNVWVTNQAPTTFKNISSWIHSNNSRQFNSPGWPLRLIFMSYRGEPEAKSLALYFDSKTWWESTRTIPASLDESLD
jgi:hypothetical protein